MRDKAASRRSVVTGGLASLTGLLLAGCDKISGTGVTTTLLDMGERLTYSVQRAILGRDALAREFTEADISPAFRANGSTDPVDENYRKMAQNGFADWTLKVDGLVEHPFEASLAELRAMPSRTQITRHDCVEGWSCIGKWTGVALSQILDRAGVQDTARYVVFHCADTMDDGSLDGPTPFYGSIDLIDARHPQTILAYDMNGEKLKVPYGAPLRLRVERQLGYKMSKYIMRIELVESFDDIGDGNGGYWEDNGYQWYAGI